MPVITSLLSRMTNYEFLSLYVTINPLADETRSVFLVVSDMYPVTHLFRVQTIS